jgi:hypothetical protein
MLRCALLLGSSILLLACSPSLNWREVRPAGGELKAMLPCKPDQGQRRQSLAGQGVVIRMVGCETGGALYAVSVAELGEGLQAPSAQAQWQTNLLGNMQASVSTRDAWPLRGASAAMEPVRLSAQGRRPDGRPVAVQAVWFAHGARLYHAAIYAERISTEMSEPFFGGLELP